MYIAKGEYGKYAKEASFIKEGNDEPLVTKAIGHVLRARQQSASRDKGDWQCLATLDD
jgi:hypothetical protein